MALLAMMCSSPARAGTATPSSVGNSAATGTPHFLTKPYEEARILRVCGGTVFVGGEFHTIVWNGKTYTRNNLFSFSASPPYTITSWNPNVNGKVWGLALNSSCTSAYVGGQFSSIHGQAVRNLAKVSVRTGSVDTPFGHDANSTVRTIMFAGGRLLVGGDFSSINGSATKYYVALDPSTGKDTRYVDLHIYGNYNWKGASTTHTDVYGQSLDPAAPKVQIVGVFTSVDGQARQQSAQIWLGAHSANATGWQAPIFNDHCTDVETFFERAAPAWSPDGSALYFASTGHHLQGWSKGSYPLTGPCDTVLKLPSASASHSPSWIEYSGCDSYFSVAADPSGDAVYAAGHERWYGNRYGCDVAGPGAVPDPGMVGLNASTGALLRTSSGAPKYSMSKANAFTMDATGSGLWIGSTNRYGSQYCNQSPDHEGICYLP